MSQISELEKFNAPLGGQEITLQEVDHVPGGNPGGMPLLRVRIREGKRFTIIDIDPLTARNWGEAMQRWALAQENAGQEAKTRG